jgi:hypothetical protein
MKPGTVSNSLAAREACTSRRLRALYSPHQSRGKKRHRRGGYRRKGERQAPARRSHGLIKPSIPSWWREESRETTSRSFPCCPRSPGAPPLSSLFFCRARRPLQRPLAVNPPPIAASIGPIYTLRLHDLAQIRLSSVAGASGLPLARRCCWRFGILVAVSGIQQHLGFSPLCWNVGTLLFAISLSALPTPPSAAF